MNERQGQGLTVAMPGRQAGLALAVVVALALALAALALAPAGAQGILIPDYPLCTEDGSQSDPAAYGDRVVWVDQRANPSGWLGDIWMYDYATGEETQITDDEYEQCDPDIWGDWVVWIDWRDGNGDVYAKNVDTGEEVAVCTNTEPQQRPKVFGDLVVWEDMRGGDWSIFYYRLSTGEGGSFSSGSDRSPDVYQDASGYVIAYEAYQDLYVYNIDTDQLRVPLEDIYGATLVAGDDEFVCGRMEEVEGTGEYELHLYRYSWSDLSVSGDKVAYTYDDGSSFKVRVHDWSQATDVPVTSVESGQSNPAIAGDMVVWQDERNYDPAGSNYLDLYTNRQVAPAATTLTIAAAKTIVPYKGTTTLTVHLTDEAEAPLAGYDVDIQKSTDWGATWTTIGSTESDGGTFVTPALTRATKFRATWEGTEDYAGTTSSYVFIKPQVALQNPDAPTAVMKYADFVVSGTLQPRHSPGWNEAVKLYCYKLDPVSGKWVLKKAVWCKTVDYLSYSKYRVTTYLGTTGTWKLRAYAPEDTLHAATWSTSHYLTVK